MRVLLRTYRIYQGFGQVNLDYGGLDVGLRQFQVMTKP